MTTVSVSEFQKNISHFEKIAQHEPVMVTSQGRESFVLLSAAEYAEYVRLKQSHYAYNGEVTEEFQGDVEGFMHTHDSVLEGLAK